MSRSKNIARCAVILAGGRGTRFWPRSRRRTPKQLLNIISEKSMLRETVDRLESLFPPRTIWAVTNEEQAAAVRRELPRVPHRQILSESVGRNTAAAIGLAAVHLAQKHGDAIMAVLPADHYIANVSRYRQIVRTAVYLAEQPGNLVVLGIPPIRPDTGFGYIERGAAASLRGAIPAYGVKRFTEKPNLEKARQYLSSKHFFWNAGMFFCRASTFLGCLKKFLPKTWSALRELQQAIGTPKYRQTLRRIYQRLENISVDYAVMEPATRPSARERVLVLPADVGWSDIGSWAAVYELLAHKKKQNAGTAGCFTADASGNFIWNHDKFAAVIGVDNLVIVDTDDALLVCPRERAQDVGEVVKWLEEKRRKDLL